MTFCLNDSGDVLIRLRPNKDHLAKIIKQKKDLADFNDDQLVDKESGENIQDSSLFYYECNEKRNRYGKHLYFDSLHD